MAEKYCETCQYYTALNEHHICTRYPPSYVGSGVPHGHFELRYPNVESGDAACGEYKGDDEQ